MAKIIESASGWNMDDLMKQEIRDFSKVFSLDKNSEPNLSLLLLKFLERLPNVDLTTFIEEYKKNYIY